MKYCPYCGADFADGAASFCMECGKSLPIVEDGQKKPKEKPVKSQKRKYRNREFWCRGYYVDTVGKNAKKIEEYIRNQLEEDRMGEQLTMGNF